MFIALVFVYSPPKKRGSSLNIFLLQRRCDTNQTVHLSGVHRILRKNLFGVFSSASSSPNSLLQAQGAGCTVARRASAPSAPSGGVGTVVVAAADVVYLIILRARLCSASVFFLFVFI